MNIDIQKMKAALADIAKPLTNPLGNPWDFYENVRKLAADAIGITYVRQEHSAVESAAAPQAHASFDAWFNASAEANKAYDRDYSRKVWYAAIAAAPQPAQAALSDAINDLMDFAPCKRAQPDGMTRGGPYVRKADVLNILAASQQPAADTSIQRTHSADMSKSDAELNISPAAAPNEPHNSTITHHNEPAAPVQAAVVPEGYALVKDSEGSALRILREALHFYAHKGHFVLHDPDSWDTVSGEPVNFYEDESNTATVEDGSVAQKALEDTFFAGTRFDFLDDDAAPSPAPVQPADAAPSQAQAMPVAAKADITRQTEAHKLARILFGMVEGDGRVEGADIYADGYSAPDGDVYVLRAAELLIEQAAESEELTRYVEHFALATQPTAQAAPASQMRDDEFQQGRAAGIEEAAKLVESKWPYWDSIYTAIRALAHKPASGEA